MRIFKRGELWGVDIRYIDPESGITYRFRKLLHEKKTIVEDKARHFEAAIVRGTFRQEYGGMFGLEINQTMTIAEGAKWYLDHYAKTAFKKKGLNQVKFTLEIFERILKNKNIMDLKIKNIEHYKTERLKNVTKSSIDRELGLISGFLNRLVKYEIISQNPVAGKIVYFNENVKRDRVASDEEIERIIQTTSNAELKMIILIGLFTGMRLSNIINLTIKNVNIEMRYFEIDQVKVRKGEKKRNVIPMSDDLYLIMILYLRKYEIQDRLFTLKDYQVSFYWKSLTLNLGINDLHFHDLRHTFASNIYRYFPEADPKIIQDLLAHSKIDMSMGVYTHSGIEKKRLAINRTSPSFLKTLDI